MDPGQEDNTGSLWTNRDEPGQPLQPHCSPVICRGICAGSPPRPCRPRILRGAGDVCGGSARSTCRRGCGHAGVCALGSRHGRLAGASGGSDGRGGDEHPRQAWDCAGGRWAAIPALRRHRLRGHGTARHVDWHRSVHISLISGQPEHMRRHRPSHAVPRGQKSIACPNLHALCGCSAVSSLRH